MLSALAVVYLVSGLPLLLHARKSGSDRYLATNNFVLSLLCLLLLVLHFVVFFKAWYAGYLYEQFAFGYRVYGHGMWLHLLLKLAALVLPLIFLWRKWRKSRLLMVMVAALLLAILVFIPFSFDQIFGPDQMIVVPGWHNTVYASMMWVHHLPLTAIAVLILDVLIGRFGMKYVA